MGTVTIFVNGHLVRVSYFCSLGYLFTD